jgi:iron(III) transport system substrate-binding protein
MAKQQIANRAGAFRIVLLVCCFAALLLFWSCSRRPSSPEVVLYSSADDALLRLIADEFQKQSHITVKIVGDTEATKTTGLVERLIAELARPRADVWWSSEPLGTIRLAREGLLQPIPPEVASSLDTGWPRELIAPDGTWRGFASRARVIVYNTAKLPTPPATLADLTQPRFKGRVGIARPQFGTTRGQMGALLAQFGEPAFRTWLEGLRQNGVRLYDGNSAVVRAVAFGEIDAGLTDTDDVYAGKREGWPVELVFAPAALGPTSEPDEVMLLPNTAALVRGGPHPREAAALLAFLLSEKAERLLATSESRNIPWRSALARDLLITPVPARLPSLVHAAGAADKAVVSCDAILR